MGISARIRADRATIEGEILLEGQRARFTANIDYPLIDAVFDEHPQSERPIDQWQLFRALELYINTHMRG